MNENELCYRRVIGSIGGTMLLFLGLINAVGLLLGFLSELLLVLPVTETVYNLTYQLIYGAGYLASFMIPVALLRRLIGRAGYAYRPMELSLNGVKWLPLIVLAGIAVVRSTAYINAEMVSFLDYLGFSSEVVWVSDTPAAYELILEFIVLCVVPGVCEEFLFRGAIQTNLRRFGRSNAILISAFLFSMMHQNAAQTLYTFAAGIVLGLIYEMTGSIWCTTVLHIINNFVSTTENAIFYAIEDIVSSSLALAILEMLLITLGVISAAILVAHFFSRKTDLRDGTFEKQLPASDGYASCPIEASRARRLFFTPTMIIFLVLCIVQMLFLLLMWR